MAEEGVNYRFEGYSLDIENRQLWRGNTRLDLNARYFDALVLLVKEHGKLVEKDRFFEQVWGDVVVSDAALTQCIKEVRRLLCDDASAPRFIATVPRFGYRFIAPVEALSPEAPSLTETPETNRDALAAMPRSRHDSRAAPSENLWRLAAWSVAGTVGGGAAGILGGLLYGSALAYGSPKAGLGMASVLVVLVSLNVAVGLIGGAGVSLGMTAGELWGRSVAWWSILGGSAGGLLAGGLTKVLGEDAFTLFFGQAPIGITGGLEGAALGLAIALGAQIGGAKRPEFASAHAKPWRAVAGGAVFGGIAGALIPLAGGHLMGGSLELLARSFSGSQLQIDALGRFFGEVHFGLVTQAVMGSVEGLLFGGCVIGGIALARRQTGLRSAGAR